MLRHPSCSPPALARLEKWLWARRILPPQMLTLPRFLGIGAQKAGTTWLYANLRRHPGLYLPRKKELRYWDWNYDLPLWSYAREFRRARGRLPGEVTPTYCAISPERIHLMRSVMPEVRLIYLVRNPVERAWSHALHNLRREGRSPDTVPREWFLAHFRGWGRTQGSALTHLANWERHFPRDQLLVGFFEDVAREPEALLSAVFEHLGVDCPADWSAYPIREERNVGTGHPLPAEFRAILSEIYLDELAALARRFGGHAEAWYAAARNA
jgi:hypothetical protein